MCGPFVLLEDDGDPAMGHKERVRRLHDWIRKAMTEEVLRIVLPDQRTQLMKVGGSDPETSLTSSIADPTQD